MKNILLLVYSLLLIAVLSSCSRYSHIPKVRAKAKTVITQKVKTKKQLSQQTLTTKIADVAPVVGGEIKPLQKVPLPETKKEIVAPKEILKSPANKKAKKANHKYTRKQAVKAQKRQTEVDFWNTDFAEFLIELAFILMLCLLVFFLHWLVEIGLGWLVAVLLIAGAIFVIVAIVDFFDGFFDKLPKYLFWGH